MCGVFLRVSSEFVQVQAKLDA